MSLRGRYSVGGTYWCIKCGVWRTDKRRSMFCPKCAHVGSKADREQRCPRPSWWEAHLEMLAQRAALELPLFPTGNRLSRYTE